MARKGAAPLDTLVRPAYLWVPDHVGSAADEAIGLAESVGLVPEPEQRLALEALLAERASGQWAALENGLVAARQNLKTFCFKIIALAKLWLFDDELVTWTAHLFPTTAEAFRDLSALAENYDHLRRRVKKVTYANGDEGIELVGGQRIQFRARTKTGGRGLTGDTIFFDEAFALAPSMMGSLFPILSVRPNPQVFYGSSGGMLQSEVLRNLRDRGRAGGDSSLTWVEWCSEPKPCANEQCDHRYGSEGCVLDDMEMVRAANPMLDRRIPREFILNERRALPVKEYTRDILGWWEDPEESVDGLPMEKWNACADRDSELDADIVLAIAVAHDLSWATIAGAGLSDFEFVHGEVIEYRSGTEWVAAKAKELVAKHSARLLVLDTAGARSTIGDELEALGVEFVERNQQELVDACGVLYDLMMRGTLRHIAQPELDYAVANGRRRPVGEAWTWARRASPVEVSPIVAVTYAVAEVVQGDGDEGPPEIY